MAGFRQVMVFCALAVTIDVAAGLGFRWMQGRVRADAGVGAVNVALEKRPDVLLLGSSRMKHHAVPSVVAGVSGLSAYNAGQDGYDFLYGAMLLDLWARVNPPPKYVVLHVDAGFLSRNVEELQRSRLFGLFAWRSSYIRSVLDQRGPLEFVKRLSMSYRANGKVFNLIKEFATGARAVGNTDGYGALWGCSPSFFGRSAALENQGLVWDFKMRSLERMAEYCRSNNARLVLVHSPYFRETESERSELLGTIDAVRAKVSEVEFWEISEFSHPELFRGKSGSFFDEAHLNDRGARDYSRVLGGKLRALGSVRDR